MKNRPDPHVSGVGASKCIQLKPTQLGNNVTILVLFRSDDVSAITSEAILKYNTNWRGEVKCQSQSKSFQYFWTCVTVRHIIYFLCLNSCILKCDLISFYNSCLKLLLFLQILRFKCEQYIFSFSHKLIVISRMSLTG
jgi:hypothetical protein